MIKESPKSKEAEQSVLGGLLLDATRIDELSGKISANDFYFDNHKLIFNAIVDLVNKDISVDRLTVAKELQDKNQLDRAGGKEYLTDLARETLTIANIVAYAEIVHEYAVMRRLLSASTEIADSVYLPDGRTSSELIENAERKIFAISEKYNEKQTVGFELVKHIAGRVAQRISDLKANKSQITGLKTPWDDLNIRTAGLQNGDLIVIAGRPSMGKTTFAMNIAEYVAGVEDVPVAVFSLEMGAEQLVMRMISSFSGIDHSKLRVGEYDEINEEAGLLGALNFCKMAPLYIFDGNDLSPADMRSWLRRLQRSLDKPLGLVLVDYLQMMRIPGYKADNKVNMVTEISRSLKIMAKEFNVPVIALAQLSRDLEKRSDNRPIMSDLRDSGGIEQDADVIMFLYRDEVYKPETKDKGVAEVIIRKQRNGPTGTTYLSFRGNVFKFDSLIEGHHRSQNNENY